MRKYQNMNTHMNTSSKKPYRYKVYMNDQDTDKGEVGSSSLPRPTIQLFRLTFLDNKVRGPIGPLKSLRIKRVISYISRKIIRSFSSANLLPLYFLKGLSDYTIDYSCFFIFSHNISC